jgi:predicted glycosyltransferase
VPRDSHQPFLRRPDGPGPTSPHSVRAQAPRILFYGHDSSGLGHLRRSLTLASSLIAIVPDAEVLLVTGSPCAALFPCPPRVGLVKIPSVGKSAGGEYLPRSLAGSLADTLRLRRDLILEAYRSFRPSLVLVDHEVIGLEGEAYEMLREARQDGVRTILGVPDIIDSPATVAVEWGGEKCRWALSEGYDRVCVYGSPEVFDARVEYPFPPELGAAVEFAGYVVRSAPPPRANREGLGRARPTVLVTMAGGGDGARLLDAYLDGLEAERPAWDSILVGGPLLDEREARRLRRRGERLGGVQIRRFHADMPHQLIECDAVLAMAGYDTCAEILQSGKPSVLLPRNHPGREEILRAERLERLGLTRSLLDPRPGELIASLAEALAAGPLPRARIPSLEGAANLGRVALELLATRARTRPVATALPA